MNNNAPSKLNLSRPLHSLNQQIFWIMLPWVIAPLLLLGVTVAKDQGYREKPAVSSSVQPEDNSQAVLFTIIFLAIGTVSCGLAILIIRRLSADLQHLDQEITKATSGNFAPVVAPQSPPSGQTQEVEQLTKSSHQLIDNFQRSVQHQQAVNAQAALFRDLLMLAQRHSDAKLIYAQAVEEAKKILGAERAFVYNFTLNWGGIIEAQAVSPNFSLLVSQQVTEAFFTKSLVEIDRYRDGLILVVHDLNTSGFSPEQLSIYEQAQIKSNIAAPIMMGDQLVGLLCLQQCSTTRQWQKWEVDVCADIANFLGLVLNQADAREKKVLDQQSANLAADKTILQPTGQHLKILSQISTQLPLSSSPHDFMMRLMEEMRKSLRLDRAILFQMDASFAGEIAVESVDPTIKSIRGEEIIDTCLQTNQGCGYEAGRISKLNDIYTANLTECHLRMMERLEVRANVVAPVIVENKLYGLLIGHMCRAARDWQHSEVDLMGQVARQVGLVMTQSSLLRQLQEQKESQTVRDQQHRAVKEGLQHQLLELIDRADI